MRLTLIISTCIGLLLGITNAQEQLFIESSAQGIQKMSIAVCAFTPKNPGKVHTFQSLPWKVIANDLKFSGRFTVTEQESNDTAQMHRDGAVVFLSGKYDITGDKVCLECSVSDAYSLNPVVTKQYSVAVNTLRRAAHLFSDETVFRLFGEKGIAGTRIVCEERAGKSKEVVVLDYDGFNKEYVTKNGKLNLTPSWSPDNRMVLYTSYRNGTPDLYTTDITSGATKQLTHNGRLNYSAYWNGVEDRIVFASSISGDGDIYSMDKDGTGLKQLTFRGSIESSPRFSPSGYEIVYSSDKTGNPQLYIIDNEGSNPRRLSFQGKYNDAPAWSPRGDKIVYQSMDAEGFNIYMVDPDGQNVKQLTKSAGRNEHPSFSPDGRLIVFSSTRAGGSDLYIMNEDGTDQTRITSFGNLYSPNWSGY